MWSRSGTGEDANHAGQVRCQAVMRCDLQISRIGADDTPRQEASKLTCSFMDARLIAFLDVSSGDRPTRPAVDVVSPLESEVELRQGFGGTDRLVSMLRAFFSLQRRKYSTVISDCLSFDVDVPVGEKLGRVCGLNIKQHWKAWKACIFHLTSGQGGYSAPRLRNSWMHASWLYSRSLPSTRLGCPAHREQMNAKDGCGHLY